MWQLDGFVPNPPGPAADALFTLTDYRRVPARDNRLLAQLARLFPGTLYFFPQGAGDRAYLETSKVTQRARNACNPGSGYARA